MKYFCFDHERKGTCYHEFYKGKFDGFSFWKNDSLFIHDDIHYELGMKDLFLSVIPEYNDCGEIEVNMDQWNRIKYNAFYIGGHLYQAILEADIWVQETFLNCSVFTMIGM